jgi:thioredoxin 1
MSDLITLNGENFSETLANGTVLADFWAPWCGPCRMIGPIIDELAADFAGKAKVCKLNVDENQDLAAKYDVMTIPTIVVFKDGNEVERIVGVRPKDELADALTKNL